MPERDLGIRFPRHHAAASLKLHAERSGRVPGEFSAASRRGLIEAHSPVNPLQGLFSFPRHHAAASLKQDLDRLIDAPTLGFPRHHAAASLKRAAAF